MNVYLDNASTTPLSSTTKNYIIQLLDEFGNPSSLHSVGKLAKETISDTRKLVAKFINADANNIYFTSGGSASNTLAIKGYEKEYKCDIFYSPIAHKSILKCVDSITSSSTVSLFVDEDGKIDINEMECMLTLCDYTPFVIIDYGNSEIGTIQDVKQIIDIVHEQGGIVMLDCTGSISTIPLDVKSLDVDIATFSAHKLGGLKGCGVLYKKPNIELEPLIYGSQEQGLVGGTENVLGIASLGKAIENYDYSSISSTNRDYVYDYIINNIPNSYIVGSLKNRLAHNLYMCFKGIEGESLMLLLDMNGIQVSTGSACNSNSITASTTLSAIGMNKDDIHSCIRMTFSGNETKEELDYVCVFFARPFWKKMQNFLENSASPNWRKLQRYRSAIFYRPDTSAGIVNCYKV